MPLSFQSNGLHAADRSVGQCPACEGRAQYPRPMADSIPSKRRVSMTVAGGAGVLIIIIVAALAWPSGRPWQRQGPPITVSSWAPYWQPDTARGSFEANSELFSDLSVVVYSASGGAPIQPYPSVPADMTATYRATAAQRGVPLLATIVDDSPEPGAMAAALADPVTRTAHVQTIVALVVDGGFGGVDLDYEKFAFVDPRSSWATTRPNWIAFLTELSGALHAIDKQLVVSVPPVYDDGQTADSGYWVYDHAAMGPLVDRIRVMAYDYSYMGGEPGAIAPIDWVERLVAALTDMVDPAKLDLGIPTYGYDWVVGVTGTCPADQPAENQAISTARAARETAERGITPIWSDATAELSYDYTDTLSGVDAAGAAVSCSVTRTVHYLDARAVHRRAYLAHRNDMHGVALWALGNEDELTWQGLRAARLGTEVWPPVAAT
jgi:spore germination protein YaaH